ncbi:AarF/UbiB family protein [Caldifermentibacillus hisashii]|uniref:AarF/UbiB family protein n=1 Tax=Caldifermentibacillus hisashii TaxID=996558 RepID=UPI0031FD0F80
MFIGEQSIEETLYNRLSLIKFCSEVDKNKIFCATIQNDIRYLDNTSVKSLVIKKLFKWMKDIQCSDLRREVIEELVGFSLDDNYFKKNNCIDASNWKRKISNIMMYIKELIPDVDLFTQSLLRNYWLLEQELCPFVNYAFGKWLLYVSDNPTEVLRNIELQAELSTVYLYRIVKIDIDNSFLMGDVIKSKGAYSYIVQHENKVYKIPKNLAAKAFINHQEALLTQKLMDTKLRNNIPAIYDFDDHSGIITREFIQGILGDDLLKKNEFQVNHKLVNSLKYVYELLIQISKEENIKFDLHPGNFIWSPEKEQWFFIDLGPVARIGSDYYPLDCFETYFQKIWLERHERMVNEPIRSVSIDSFIN